MAENSLLRKNMNVKEYEELYQYINGKILKREIPVNEYKMIIVRDIKEMFEKLKRQITKLENKIEKNKMKYKTIVNENQTLLKKNNESKDEKLKLEGDLKCF
jgi:uncharacterized protein YaaN involved in tellurite resistance